MDFLKKAAKLADKANPMNLISKAGATIAEKTVQTVTNKEVRDNFSMSGMLKDSVMNVTQEANNMKNETLDVGLEAGTVMKETK